MHTGRYVDGRGASMGIKDCVSWLPSLRPTNSGGDRASVRSRGRVKVCENRRLRRGFLRFDAQVSVRKYFLKRSASRG